MDPKVLKSFDAEKYTFIVDDNKGITLHGVKYKKVSSTTVTIEDTKYTADNLIKDLVKIPKFYEMDDTHISDPYSGFTTELRQYVYY